MNEQTRSVAVECSRASEEDRLSFPQIVAALGAAGVESYHADFRRANKTYYLPDGETLVVPARDYGVQPAKAFDPAALQAAIREAQANGPDYSYDRFCKKVLAAGCVGYIVSLAGRRAVYFGRTGETHVELFPTARN